MRANQGQELVIAGYTPSSKNFDALVIGYYEGGKLMYAARTRNGFTPASRAELFRRLKPLEIEEFSATRRPRLPGERERPSWAPHPCRPIQTHGREQAPSDIFVRAAFPVVEHLCNVRWELDRCKSGRGYPPDRECGSGCRGFGVTRGCGCCRCGCWRRGGGTVFSTVATRRSDSNAGRGGRDAEVAIDLAGGEAGGAGDRGCALALPGHLLDPGALGKMHGVFRVLTVGFGNLCGPLMR
jgi:hypothetical protein